MDVEATLPEYIGPYQATGYLGRGGMGEVLRGHDRRLDRPVALKRVRPGGKDPEAARQRFQREARVVAKLNHPAIVQVYDWVEAEDHDWLVMELVDGRPLDEVLEDGPLPPERAAAIAREVASGLAAAHEAGLVHRDLKAANVMVTASGGHSSGVKILDFGIAKKVGLDTEGAGGEGRPTTLTEAGQVVGTVASMSPEQALGYPVDHRSDLFSLGTLLYEMLTGVSPFEGDSAVETLSRICSAKEKPLRQLDPNVPHGLAQLVARLLEKEPARRPGGALEVVAELDRLAAGSDSTDEADTAETLTTGSNDPTLLLPGVGISRSVVRTLLLSDLVGSTRLVERLGDQRAAEVFERHDLLARRLMAEHDGREVDKSDGFLVLFPRPLAAVGYALAYHAALVELSEREGIELASRVGIHVGEVVVRENESADVARGAKPLEVEGLAKAMAARFMSLARGGQTLISRGVFDMGRRAAVGAASLPEGLRWLEHGRYRIKGVEEPVGVFEVGVEGTAPLVAPADSEKVSRVMERSWTYSIPKLSRGWVVPLVAAAVLVLAGLWGLSPWLQPAVEVPAFVKPLATEAHGDAALTSHALYQRAVGHLERYDLEGNIDRALADFQRALARDQSYAPALAGLADAYRLDHYSGSQDPKRLQQALAAAEGALQLNEHLAVARVSLGLVYYEMGRYDEAVTELENALQIEPLNADAHYGLAKVAEARGDVAHAESEYRRAIEAEPGNWLFQSHLGSLFYKSGRFDDAAAAFSRQLELTPDSSVAFRNLGGTYYMQGRLAEAATQFQRALQIQPDATIYANLGTIYFAQGLYVQSVSAFEDAIETGGGSNDYRIWGNLADAYRWTPDQETRAREAYLRAIQLLKERLAEKPEDPSLRSRLVLFLAKNGDCDRALTELGQISDLPRKDVYAWFRLAVTHEVCGRRTDALAALEIALQAGFPIEEAQTDPELLKLRQDASYHRLVMRLESTSGS